MARVACRRFPFLFGGTFIEGGFNACDIPKDPEFPFLFGGTFIEGALSAAGAGVSQVFPFLFGGTFIEGQSSRVRRCRACGISLPFRRDFH